MDRIKQRMRKDKPQKHVDREKSTTDVKLIKENLKIKEILRTVKINNSMRVKAPRGSKVMNNKDFNDNDDLFEDLRSNYEEKQQDEQQDDRSYSATNHDVIIDANNVDINETKTEDSGEIAQGLAEIPKQKYLHCTKPSEECNIEPSNTKNKRMILEEESSTDIDYDDAHAANSVPSSMEIQINVENSHIKNRDRKLSLDQTMLTRLEGLSQSELDLYSIGKSPLERKSSFFRKKMESFFKNTTEIFKRQSMSSKTHPVQRRGSMSASLQSLHENRDYNTLPKTSQGSVRSLHSSSTVGHSTSSLSASQPTVAPSEQGSLSGSQPLLLSSSQPLAEQPSDSEHSLNEDYMPESMLNARAFSMSSGLDSAHATRRRKSSNRSNRVTWVASEGLSSYFRRLIQDEKYNEMQVCHSYADFTTIPENELCGSRADSKGRRLSYQRAISGEDAPSRRRHLASDHAEANQELSSLLAEFTQNGVPPLKGFTIANISDESFAYLTWAQHPPNLEEVYNRKKVSPCEESRQAVIRELITTEAVHIQHLKSIVEVFIAAAHALQDAGKLLDVDTEKLFSNIPDVLNASLIFWDTTLYPMIADAMTNSTPFNTEMMSQGFCHFADIFAPYEKFVSEQTKALDYLRSLSGNTDFMMYLTWCHSQKECNRLQLSDIMVKPMQRLTKYSLILRRIISHTEIEPERTSLVAMVRFSKNHVLDLNRSIRQREELEKLDALANSIDSYEIDFKDEEMDRYFRLHSQLNLKAPMLNSLPSHSRSIIFEGDLRYKDKDKEIEVRVFLLTDMLLITKKQSKGCVYPFKLIRPKFMVDKLVLYPRHHPKNPKELVALVCVAVDEVGSSHNAFTLTESQKEKDPNVQSSIKVWEQKFREARLSYDIGVWFAKNPSRDLSEVEMDSSSDYGLSSGIQQSGGGGKQNSEDLTIEREARERVAVMLHRNLGASTEHDYSQASMTTDSFDAAGDGSGASGAFPRPPGLHTLRYPMHRNSTGGSSRNSRLSSFQQSTSAASHDEPQTDSSKNMYRAGSSVEHVIPPLNPDDSATSITVNVVSESESETVVPLQQQVLPPRPGSRSPTSSNTLRVSPQSGVLALMHSLPDLTVDRSPPRPAPCPSPQSASDKLYQSHQELLQRNRLTAQAQHYLTPDHRGSSYPPPSPTRASLKRGLAFSYSFKNPPLSKMGHVYSQSQIQAEGGSSHGQIKSESRASTPVPMSLPPPGGPSSEKTEKKSKQFISRNKGGTTRSAATTGQTTDTTNANPTGSTSGRAGTSGIAGGSGTSASAATTGTPGTSCTAAMHSSAQTTIVKPSAYDIDDEIIVITDTAGTSNAVATKAGTSGKPGAKGKTGPKGKGKTSTVRQEDKEDYRRRHDKEK